MNNGKNGRFSESCEVVGRESTFYLYPFFVVQVMRRVFGAPLPRNVWFDPLTDSVHQSFSNY